MVAERRRLEEWRAIEIASNLAKPATPTRVVDLGKMKVVCYCGGRNQNKEIHNGISVIGADLPLPDGWSQYGLAKPSSTDMRANTDREHNQMSTDNPESPQSSLAVETMQATQSAVEEVQAVQTTAAQVPAPQAAPTPVQIDETKSVVALPSVPVEHFKLPELAKPSSLPPVALPRAETANADTESQVHANVDALLADIDTAEAADTGNDTKGNSNPVWIGNPKVALLFSGGINSTAMFLYLLAKGYRVAPYYVRDAATEEMSAREANICGKIVRIAMANVPPDKDGGSLIEPLEYIDVRIMKAQLQRRRRRYVELLTRELIGHGFNAIAYGKQGLAPNPSLPEGEDEEAADTDVMFLQELTPLQVISPETFDLPKLESVIVAALETLDENFVKSMLFASTSCEQRTTLECGNCRSCLQRLQLFWRLFTEDGTKYVKGSKARIRRKKVRKLAESQDPADLSKIKDILFPLKKKK